MFWHWKMSQWEQADKDKKKNKTKQDTNQEIKIFKVAIKQI